MARGSAYLGDHRLHRFIVVRFRFHFRPYTYISENGVSFLTSIRGDIFVSASSRRNSLEKRRLQSSRKKETSARDTKSDEILGNWKFSPQETKEPQELLPAALEDYPGVCFLPGCCGKGPNRYHSDSLVTQHGLRFQEAALQQPINRLFTDLKILRRLNNG